MPESQVISFRANGAFLRWLEASRVLDESTSQAASRLLRSFAVTADVQPFASNSQRFYTTEVKPFATASNFPSEILCSFCDGLSARSVDDGGCDCLECDNGYITEEFLRTQETEYLVNTYGSSDYKAIWLKLVSARVQPFAVTQPPDRSLALSQSDISLMFPVSESANTSAVIQNLQSQLEELRSQLQAVSQVRESLNDSIVDFESQLEAGRSDYDQLEILLESTKTDVLLLQAENSSLKESIAKFVAVPQFDSSEFLNKLRSSNKKSNASLADIQFVVELVLEQLNFF